MSGFRDAALEAEGWVRRSVLGEPRLSEVTAAYREAGFEVRVEDPDPADLPDACTDCAVLRNAKVVYTRRRTVPLAV